MQRKNTSKSAIKSKYTESGFIGLMARIMGFISIKNENNTSKFW